MSLRPGVTVRLGLFFLCLTAAASVAQPPRPPARREDPHGRADFFRLKRAPVGKQVIPVDRYFEALKQMRAMRGHSLRVQDFLPSRDELEKRGLSYILEEERLGAWSSLGPGNVGGRTRALILDPRQPDTLYAGGVAGGVWKSTDGGLSWTALDDLAPNLAIGSLAMDPSSSQIVYAGTGEGYFNEDAVRGAGIFKTTDGGLNWTQLASTDNPNFHYVNDIVISRRDPRRVYAATRTGVWRSKNRGRSWNRVLSPKVYGGCLDLALRTDLSSDFLFASCGTREGTAAVWRNDEAEKKGGWEQVLSESEMGRTTLAIAPSDQDVVYALASTNQKGSFYWGLSAVFRSDDGGRTWNAQVRNTDPAPLNRLLLTNAYFAISECGGNGNINQGWYDNSIAVDPVNPDRVWAGGIDLFRSDDGGKSWGVMSSWLQPGEDEYVHADQHAIVFHPRYDGVANKTLFVANDGGLFKTADALAAPAMSPSAVCSFGAIQTDWTSLNNGYGVTQFYYGIPYPDGATYFGGSQDTGVLKGSGNPDAWDVIFPGDAGYVAVDPVNTDVVYASLTNLSIYKSTDGWKSFAPATSGIAGDKFLFITPFVLDPADPKRLWTGGGRLWHTTNGAGTWGLASAQLQGQVSTIAVFPTDSDRVLAGTSEGWIYRSTSARTATKDTVWASAQPRKGFVSSVAFDPSDPNVVYATYSNFGGVHVWKSTDGGATWTGIDGVGRGALPDLPVNAIAVDPEDEKILYLGTDLGVFVSKDGGANWLVENTGFANVMTAWLAVLKHPDGTRSLFAFTHGRGAWKISLD